VWIYIYAVSVGSTLTSHDQCARCDSVTIIKRLQVSGLALTCHSFIRSFQSLMTVSQKPGAEFRSALLSYDYTPTHHVLSRMLVTACRQGYEIIVNQAVGTKGIRLCKSGYRSNS
jgi:hypothetical protein